MSQQLTNKEIAKVFALYFDSEIGQIDSHGKWDYNLHMQRYHVAAYHQREGNVFEGVKLLLILLDQISDEDAIAVAMFNYTESVHMDERKKIGKDYIDYNFLNKSLSLYWEARQREFDSTDHINIFQYLISKGYAVPLWFGIDHWANGKTAIELNIAISKTLK